MNPEHSTRLENLVHIVQASPWFMPALEAVQSLHLNSWCIGAGAVRNLVGDYIHEYTTPSSLTDIDVAYFDANDLRPETEDEIQTALETHFPQFPWEVIPFPIH